MVPRQAGTGLCLPDGPGGPDVGNFLAEGGSHKAQPTGIKGAKLRKQPSRRTGSASLLEVLSDRRPLN